MVAHELFCGWLSLVYRLSLYLLLSSLHSESIGRYLQKVSRLLSAGGILQELVPRD